MFNGGRSSSINFEIFSAVLFFSSNKLEKISSNKEYIEIKIPVPNDQEIVFVEDVYQDSNDVYGVGYYGAGMPIHNTNMMADLMLTNIGADMSNMAYPKFTFEFLIYSYFSSILMVIFTGIPSFSIKVTHVFKQCKTTKHKLPKKCHKLPKS